MSNLLLTTRCNRRCGYCFAGEAGSRREMTLAEAARAMDLVVASGLEQVRLLGGEPTLHPHFAAVLQAARERGLQALVFSNGLMQPSALAALEGMAPDECHVLLNLNLGVKEPAAQRERVAAVARALGERASVGVNLYRPGLPLEEVFAFAQRHGLAQVIRLGLAHPRLDRRNVFLHPRHYLQVGGEIKRFFELIGPAGFELRFDCGFVPCMFRPEFLKTVGLTASDLGRRCGPIPDLLPDRTAIHCFPLSELDQLPVSGAKTIQELRESLEARAAFTGAAGIFRECAGCELWASGECLGGCRSAAQLRANRTKLAPQANHVREAATKLAPQLWAIPYVDQPLDFWAALSQNFGPAISELYFPIALNGVGTGRPPQPSAHLAALLEDAPLPLAVLANPLVLPKPLAELGPPLVDELARLHEEHGVMAATLTDARLAELVRRRLPAMRLTASCLLEVVEPEQAETLNGLFDVLVPATRVLRHPERLKAIREAFSGRLRLLVNEGCLDTCLDRKQHFYEMATVEGAPQSLCAERLERTPWLRLTGAWILPQHLRLVTPYADEFKLAGRVTLREAEHYRRVLGAYVEGRALWPHEIGGGPATPVSPRALPLAHAQFTGRCNHLCGKCAVCRRAWSAGAHA